MARNVFNYLRFLVRIVTAYLRAHADSIVLLVFLFGMIADLTWGI